MPKILAAIAELAALLAASWILTLLSLFLHELGHAIGYMLATGDRRWHIRIGWGKPLLDTKRLTVNLLVFDGFFTPSEKKIDTRAKLAATLSGGPAASLLLTAGLTALRFAGPSFQSDFLSDGAVEWFLNFPLFGNLFILLASLLPGRYLFGKVRGLESDGLQIIHAVKKEKD